MCFYKETFFDDQDVKTGNRNAMSSCGCNSKIKENGYNAYEVPDYFGKGGAGDARVRTQNDEAGATGVLTQLATALTNGLVFIGKTADGILNFAPEGSRGDRK